MSAFSKRSQNNKKTEQKLYERPYQNSESMPYLVRKHVFY